MINKSLELQIITDDLTGLFNRRYLNIKLKEECERSQRQKVKFALVMLDLDHFKEVNDNFGHSEGDEALIWISNILKNSVRSFDIVIRFAGDEFFLILPGASFEEANLVSKRIYQNISNSPFRGSENQVNVPVGISGGIAIFPEDASNADDLIKSADNGLYLAKEQGRGKICLAKDALNLKNKKIDKNTILIPPFIGRKNELNSIKQAFEYINENKKSFVSFIQGNLGIGKTRFIIEFLTTIQQHNILKLSSSCHLRELEIPYQIIIDLLTSWIEFDKKKFYKHFLLLSPTSRQELIKLVPSLEVLQKQDLSQNNDDISDNTKLYFAFTQLIKSISLEQPIIIVVENLQWIDTASLDLISHIILQNLSLPILFIISSKIIKFNENPEISKFIRRIARETKFEEINLKPLENKYTSQIIKKIFKFDDPKIQTSIENLIINEAEGNPLFIRELLLKLLNEKILILNEKGWTINDINSLSTPDRIKDIVIERIETLNEELKNLLKIASIIGKEFFFEILKDISSMNEGYILDLLDRALELGFLEEIPNNKFESYCFSSLQVQKFLYDELSQIRKRRYHKQILEIFEHKYHNKLGDFIETLLHHSQKASILEKTFSYGIKCALKAFSTYGLKESKQFFIIGINAYNELDKNRKSIYLQEYFEAIHKYVELLILLGEYNEAINIINTLDPTPQINDLLAYIYFKKGNYQKAIDLYQNAFNKTEDKSLKSKIQSRLSNIFVHQGLYDEAEIHAYKALNIAKSINNSSIEALALKMLGNFKFNQNKFDESIKYYRTSLKTYKKLDEPSGIASCFNNIGLIHYKRKKYNLALKCFQLGKNICDQIGLYSLNILILNNMGNVLFDSEKIDEAQKYFTQCLQIAEDIEDASTVIASYLNLGNIFLKIDIDKSESYFQKGLDICKKIGEKSKESFFYNILGDLYFNSNKYKDSETFFYKAIALRSELKENENEIFSSIKLLELYETIKDNNKFINLIKKIEDKLNFYSKNSSETILHLKNEFDLIKSRNNL